MAVLEVRWPEGIPRSEINMAFVQAMADRMAVSYFKYGGMREKPGEVFDHLASVAKRIEMYRGTGNIEGLVDAANFLMIEFTNPSHPDAHFEGTDSDVSPGIKYVGGPWVQKPDF
jgi:hypothetical protein